MKRPITPEEKEKLRASFSQKIASGQAVTMNYEQYLIGCLLTASGPQITKDDAVNAIHSAELIITEMAWQQANMVKEVEATNG